MSWFGVAGAIVIVGTAGWVVSPVLDGSFRRMFTAASRVLISGFVCSLVGAVVLVRVAPVLVGAVGVIAVVVLAGATARASLGRRRDEPPGSRSPVRWVRELAHRDAYRRQFDVHGPVIVASQFGRTVVCVHGVDRGQRLLRDHRDSLGPSPLPFSQQMMGGFLRYMDDETHDRYGLLFRRALSREVTELASRAARDSTEDMMTALGPDPLDPRPALRNVVEDALLLALFGLGSAHPDTAAFRVAFEQFSARSIQHRANRAARRGLVELRQRSESLVGRTDVGTNVLSGLANLDPSMPDEVAIDNLLFMLRIGTANTTALAIWGLEFLAAAPELRHRLASDPTTMAPALIDETLRLAQSEYLYRRLRNDLQFEGFRLRAGWLIRICVAESHRDPDRFACPAVFTDRFVEGRPPSSVFAPFGMDRHACNAAGLATGVVGAILTTIAAVPDVELTASGEVVRDLRHWSHWRPGPGLAISRASSSDPAR